MAEYTLTMTLLSDTTIGRGDGVAGLVDNEVEHDLETGIPYIRGRTIKGLLVESCADVLYGIQMARGELPNELVQAAHTLFGSPGSRLEYQAQLTFGRAELPQDLRDMIAASRYTREEVLDSLTTIRYQTAVDAALDTPKQETLRANRAVIRETQFVSTIISQRKLENLEASLLATCIAATRRAGLSRNRGRGRITMTIDGLNADPNDLQGWLTS